MNKNRLKDIGIKNSHFKMKKVKKFWVFSSMLIAFFGVHQLTDFNVKADTKKDETDQVNDKASISPIVSDIVKDAQAKDQQNKDDRTAQELEDAKTTGKVAIDNRANEERAKIDALTDLSDKDKDTAKAAIDKWADAEKDKIDQVTDKTAIPPIVDDFDVSDIVKDAQAKDQQNKDDRTKVPGKNTKITSTMATNNNELANQVSKDSTSNGVSSKLPATGSEDSSASIASGIVLSIVSFFSLLFIKKEKQNN